MRILQAHKNFYSKGRDTKVFFSTATLLKRHGHEVVFFLMSHPDDVESEYSNGEVAEKAPLCLEPGFCRPSPGRLFLDGVCEADGF